MADSFFTELKKRNVFKVGTAYIVLAWVVVQVSDTVFPQFDFPAWTNQFVTILMALGFPVALFFAWAFEITPDGINKESDLLPEDSTNAHPGRKLAFVIVSILTVALSYYIVKDRFESAPLRLEPSVVERLISNPSIAVLPFVNMSSDPEQEYFSDGISEEILNVLSKIPNLHVTSRSSAFAFKGKELDLKKVAQQLGVDHILEGSVRKSGTKVRITAQLIEASTDRHLWSETYDRELTDIFAIQDELSVAIVAVLKIKLMGDNPVLNAGVRKVNLEAHTAFLKGLHFLNKSGTQAAKSYFDDAIKFDNTYAIAYAYRGLTINILTKTGKISLTEGPQIAMTAIDRAIKIDPELAIAYVYRSLNKLWFDFDLKGASLDLELAKTFNPNIAEIYGNLSSLYSMQGNHQQAVLHAQKGKSLDPLTPFISRRLIRAYFFKGDYQQALAEIEDAYTISPYNKALLTLNASVNLAMGNNENALLVSNKMSVYSAARTQAMAYSNLGNITKSDEALAIYIKQGAADSAYQIAEIYCVRGEIEQCLDWLDRAYKQKDPGVLKLMVSPFLKPVFQEKRFKELVLKMDIF